MRSKLGLKRGIDCLFRGEMSIYGFDSFFCRFLSSCLGYPILWCPIVAPKPMEEFEYSFRGSFEGYVGRLRLFLSPEGARERTHQV
jgi:hypothetical protein